LKQSQWRREWVRGIRRPLHRLPGANGPKAAFRTQNNKTTRSNTHVGLNVSSPKRERQQSTPLTTLNSSRTFVKDKWSNILTKGRMKGANFLRREKFSVTPARREPTSARMIPFAAKTAANTANTFERARQAPKISHLRMGSRPHLIHVSLSPHELTPNGISIGLAVFDGPTNVTNKHTDTQTTLLCLYHRPESFAMHAMRPNNKYRTALSFAAVIGCFMSRERRLYSSTTNMMDNQSCRHQNRDGKRQHKLCATKRFAATAESETMNYFIGVGTEGGSGSLTFFKLGTRLF